MVKTPTAQFAYKLIIYYKDKTKRQMLTTEKDIDFMIENEIFSHFQYARLPKTGYEIRKEVKSNYSVNIKSERGNQWNIDMLNIKAWGYYPVFPLQEE